MRLEYNTIGHELDLLEAQDRLTDLRKDLSKAVKTLESAYTSVELAEENIREVLTEIEMVKGKLE